MKCAADNGGHEHDETEPQRAADKASRCHPPPPPIPGVGQKKAPRNSIPLRVIRFTALRSPPGNRRGGNLGEHRRRVADQELIKIERVFQIIIRRRRKTAGGRTFDEAALAGIAIKKLVDVAGPQRARA